MKALRLIAVAALAVAASAQSFANSYVLGTLTVPSLAPPVIADHNGLAINATFTDTYSFSFTAPAPGGATTTGVLIDYTPLNDVLLQSVSLYSGLVGSGTLIQTQNVVTSPFTFSFTQQPSGNYYLSVVGKAIQSPLDPSSTSHSYTTRVSLVPEPGTLALFGLGLAGAGFAARRGRKSVAVAG